jgi:PKD domain-containing protein
MHGVVGRGLLLCLIWLGVAAAPAHSAGWAPLRPVGVGIANNDGLAADLSPSGAAAIVWRGTSEGHQAILASSGVAGGAFTSPVVISGGTADVGRPALAVSSGGVAVATWSQNGSVMAAVRSSSGTWAPPEPVAVTSDPVPSVAIGDNGKAVVTWVGNGVWGLGPQASWRVPGGVWTAPEYIERYPGGETQVAIDAHGNATALWRRSPTSSDPPSIVAVAERPAGSDEWSSPVQTWGSGAWLQLAVARSGAAAVTWEASPGVVMATVRSAGGSWSGAENTNVQLGDYITEVPDIAIDGGGAATVIVPRLVGGVDVNRRPAGGAWPDDEQHLAVPVSTENSQYPAVAANGRGFTLISWFGLKDPHPFGGGGTPLAQVATRLPSGSWTQPLAIGNPGGTVAIDVDESDNGLVCWTTRTATAAIQCRAYDATPPRLLDLAVPATGRAELPVSFGVRPVDSFSALGATTWDFGDGTAATGTRPAHTYARAGRYTVRVTARDVLGNATSAQRVITIAPAPPRITGLDADFRRATFQRSRLSDQARVRIAGTITAPLRVSLRLTGPVRPRAERKTVELAERRLDAGAFSESVRIPGALAARLLPGKYELEVSGPGLTPAAARLKLGAPRQGVVMARRISRSRTGPNLLHVTDAKRLWATFTFAPGAAAKQDLRAVWYAPNRKAPVGSFPVKRAFSWWGNPNGLAAGRWRCALVARGRVVDSVSIVVG